MLEAWISKSGETIISDENGKLMTDDHSRRQCYYPALKKIGVRRLSSHTTRHTCLTRLAAGARQSVDTLRKAMGKTS